MDEARKCEDDAVWSADEIHELGDASIICWRCIGCDAIVIPAAWDPDKKYKRTPYFRAKTKHKEDCTAEKLEKMMKVKERKNKIKSEDGLPGTYPSAVRFSDQINAQEGCERQRERIGDDYRPESNDKGNGSKNPNHKRTAVTITPICKFYNAFPLLRHLSLRVPGCDGNTYRDIFQPISNNYTGQVERKILYASIRFKEAPDYSDDSKLKIALNLSNTDSQNKAPVYLQINWYYWSKQRKGVLRNKIEKIRKELKNKYLKTDLETESNKKPYGRIFFIGSRLDANQFLVEDSRKICLLQSWP